MKYTFHGALRGRLAREFEEPLDSVDVRLYDVDRDDLEEPGIQQAAQARPKETFSILTDEQVEQKRDALIAEGTTESDGSFSIDIDESTTYRADDQGRPSLFQIDVRVDGIPQADIQAEEPVQFTLTVHDPEWEPAEPASGDEHEMTATAGAAELEDQQVEQQIAEYQETIPAKNWCAVLEELGIWVVCGRVTNENTATPLPNMEVTARDADIVQHDELGSGVTNSNGEFSIYYTPADFEETPPPWGPIELIPGPDLYFTVERAGKTFLDEDSSAGRAGGRENADHCEYVELEVTLEEVPETPGEPTMPTLWDRIGNAFSVSGTPNDFDTDGYAGANKYALYGTITLEGQAPLYHRRKPDQFVEYRVKVTEDPESTSPTYEPIGVGTSTYQDAFVEGLVIGKLLVVAPTTGDLEMVKVRASRSHLDGDGWLSVRDAANDALQARYGSTTTLGSLGHENHSWFDADELARIDTRQFTSEPDVRNASTSDPVPDAGDPVPASRQIDVEKIGIKFEAKVLDAGGSKVPNPKDVQNEKQAPIVVNNNSAFVEFVNNNHEQANDKCKILSGDVSLGYTAYHPHLDGVRITVRRNSEHAGHPKSVSLDDANLPFDFDPVAIPNLNSDADAHFHNDSITILRNPDSSREDEPILTKKCGYEASIGLRRRLHNGYHRDDWDQYDSSIFYWDGASP